MRQALRKAEAQRLSRIEDLTRDRELAQKELAACGAEIRGLAAVVGRPDEAVTNRMADVEERIGRLHRRLAELVPELEGLDAGAVDEKGFREA